MDSHLEEVIANLRKEIQTPNGSKSSIWQRYEDTVNAMSSEQRAWICKQEAVVQAKTLMYSDFLDYMFSQHRENFVSVDNGRYEQSVSNYIDTIRKSAGTYVSRAEQLEKENEELRIRLNKLLEKQDESMAADGTRRSGKGSADELVRTGSNSRQDSQNLELFENRP